MNNKLMVVIVLVIVILGAGYYFMNQKSMSYSPSTQPQPTTEAAGSGAISGSGGGTSPAAGQTINVEGNEFAFTPSTITVKMGQPVQINFTNTGKYPHNLMIADLNVKTKTIQPGQSDSVTFTPDKVGSFGFICSVTGHADKGMTGTLTVE